MYICRVCVDFVTLESTFKDLVHGDIFKRQSQGEKKSQYYICDYTLYMHMHIHADGSGSGTGNIGMCVG